MQQESCFYFSVSSKTFVRTKPTEQETGFWFQPEGHAALLKEPQSSVLIWWVDGEHDRQTILRPHKSSRLPENDCFWLFSLDDCVSVSSLCQITVGKSFTSSLKNAAASFKTAPEPHYWWLLIISVVRDLRRSATGSFVLLKQSAPLCHLGGVWW